MQYSDNPFADTLTKIAQAAKEANPREDGDYTENGLLHCGKCHTPKETTVTLGGRETKVSCMCKCREEQAEAKRKKFIHDSRAEALKDSAYGDKALRNCCFENDDGTNPELTKKCRNYVENFERFSESGKGLLFFGSCGTGKTYAALEIANALMDKLYSVKFATFAAIANELFDNPEKQGYINRLAQDYDLLCIDDYAAERNTPWMNEQLFAVIDARCKAHKPLIVTTNLTRDEMFDRKNIDRYRICSRLLELCIAVEVNGKDRRISDYIKNKAEFEDLLNQ